MLVGRSAECARLEGVLEQARAGRAGALVLRGEAGAGKSSLLEHAAGTATGFQVLRCRGAEGDSELAFTGLAGLLAPLTPLLAEIPPPQATALAAALGLSAGPGAERFAVCAATLSLLAAGAERRPLLVLVDDGHWLDGASLECLIFAVRRM